MNGNDQTKEEQETLKSFLGAEIKDLEDSLVKLKSQLKRLDLGFLEEELKDKKSILTSLNDGDSRLFFLRREIVNLRKRIESLPTRQSLIQRIPLQVWIVIISLPIVIYIVWLAILQNQNQPQIQAFQLQTVTAQTATAAAMSTAMPSITETTAPPLITPTP